MKGQAERLKVLDLADKQPANPPDEFALSRAAQRGDRSSLLSRAADRYVGIPLVAIAAGLRRKKQWPSTVRRIGVLQPSAIGDLILASGVFQALHEKYPDAEILLIHGKSNSAAHALMPVSVQPIQLKSLGPKALRQLRDLKLDLSIDLTPWPRITALLMAYSGGYAIGYDSRRQFRSRVFDTAVPHSIDSHEVENHSRLSSLFSTSNYNVTVRVDANQYPRFIENPSQLILLHVSAGGSRAANKEWPQGSWSELARQLAAKGFVLAITGTSKDRAVADSIIRRAALPDDQFFSLCGRIGLQSLAALIQRVALVITIDTGVLHLTSAIGTPMVTLHGPTVHERWGSRSENTVVVASPHPQKGYIRFGFELSPTSDNIMKFIPVDQVLKAAQDALHLSRPGSVNR